MFVVSATNAQGRGSEHDPCLHTDEARPQPQRHHLVSPAEGAACHNHE